MTLLWDNKRKDFTEQIVHHIATLLLLCKSLPDTVVINALYKH